MNLLQSVSAFMSVCVFDAVFVAVLVPVSEPVAVSLSVSVSVSMSAAVLVSPTHSFLSACATGADLHGKFFVPI